MSRIDRQETPMPAALFSPRWLEGGAHTADLHRAFRADSALLDSIFQLNAMHVNTCRGVCVLIAHQLVLFFGEGQMQHSVGAQAVIAHLQPTSHLIL